MMPRKVISFFINCCFVLVGSFSIRAAELSNDPMLRIASGRHTATITRIDTDRAGRWLVSSSQDKTVRVWDAATGQMIRVLRPPSGEAQEGELFAVAISPDGALVACGGWTQAGSDRGFTVYLFLRSNGRLVGRIQGLPNTIGHLTFSPDGTMLAVALESGGMRVFTLERRTNGGRITSDLVTARLLAGDSNYGGLSDWASFSPDSRWLVTSDEDGYVRLYGVSGLVKSERPRSISPNVKQKLAGGNRPHSVVFSPDGSKIAVGFHHMSTVNVLSALDLRLIAAPDTRGVTNGDLSAAAWSSDGRYLYGAGLRSTPRGVPIRRWPTGGEEPPADILSGALNTITDMVPLPGGAMAVGAAGPTIAVLNPDGTRRWLVSPGIADFRNGDLWLSEGGETVSFGFEAGGASPATFSLADRSLVTGAAAVSARTSQSLAPPLRTAPGIDVRGWANTVTPTLNGRLLPLKQFETSLSMAIAPDGKSFVLGTEWYLRRFERNGKQAWSVPVPSAAWTVSVARGGAVVVAGCGDGTIRWYRFSDGRQLAAFFPDSDRERWVAWTPDGYYDASPGGEELIGWQVNNGKDREADFYPASRFHNIKYRPEALSRIIKAPDESDMARIADGENAKTSGMSAITAALPPVVTIVDPEDGSHVSSTSVTLHYTLRSPSGQPVTGIRAMVDGRPVSTTRGVRLLVDENDVQTVTVTTPAHDSDVSLIAENRFAASVPATVHLVWDTAAKSEQFVAKPKLYVLAVGISAYQKPELRLQYAAKDARDFSTVMQAQKGALYRDVEIKLLTDAPKDDVEDGLDWLQRQVTSRDVGIIFLAGHGVDDPNGIYYFLPANADLERLKATGLAFSDVKNTVSSIAGKAILFVDTCHSGDILGARRGVADINAVVNELSSAENGVVVFTASTGRQYSLEDPKWQNGAFTKALVEGLDGKADYTGKGSITVNMLDLYLAERVKELTNGEQTPATAKPSTVPDFPLAIDRGNSQTQAAALR
ncbi:MAG TPA: caspase family protein [Terriglobia bacterium]|nr:caspase family protein [Terriglobia bacterium]